MTTTCLICGREISLDRGKWPQFPFCSQRCRTIDLGRWLGEKYTLPSPANDEEKSSAGEEE